MTTCRDVELQFLTSLSGSDLAGLVRVSGFDPFVRSKTDAASGANLQALKPDDEMVREIEARRHDLVDHILGITTHWVAKMWQAKPEYRAVVRDVAESLEIDLPNGLAAPAMEQRVILAVLERMQKHATPEERDALAKALEKEFPAGNADEVRGLMTGAGVLALGNLVGFSLYVGATTVVGAISGAIGITLPFAIYTTMSSTLAVLLGPVGWSALGAAAVYKLGQPNMRTALATVGEIARLRSLEDPAVRKLAQANLQVP